MNQYIIFDLETTSINSKYTEIIEIAAIKIVGSSIVDEFNTLVKPSNTIDASATAVNGITNNMVSNAPYITDVFPDFLDFIGTDLLVGYNIASFDLPILRRIASNTFGKELQNKYIDILYLARERLSFLPNCKLTTIATYFGISIDNAHRALADCYISKNCYEKILELSPCKSITKKKKPRIYKTSFTEQTKALQTLQVSLLGVIADNVLSEAEVYALKNWLDANSNLSGQYPFDRVFAVIENSLEDGILEQHELDEMLSLFKKFTDPANEYSRSVDDLSFESKSICITGNFNYGSRKDVEELIIRAKGICKKSVSRNTDYVIVGSMGSADWTCGNYGTKIKRALELQNQGFSLQIIKEETFIDALKKMEIIL